LANARGLVRSALALMTPFVAAATVTACDPCAGVIACSTAPRVAVQGRIVDVNDGHPIPGTRIYLVRSDSAARDSATTVTDAQGNFQVEVASSSGKFDIVVAPPGLPSYRVPALPLESSTRRGEGSVLGVWVATPIFATTGELILRTSNQLVPAGVSVTFHRTGGVAIVGSDTYTSVTDGAGRVQLLTGVAAAGTEDVVGELTVTLPGALGTSVFSNFHLTPRYQFRPSDVLRLAVGPELSWFVQIYDRATVVPVPGTTVTFHRTGGIPTSPEQFTAVTDKDGLFFVPLIPQAKGTLVGDLTVQPPAPYRGYVRTGIEIPTFDADGVRFLSGFGVGPHLPWLGVVTCDGKPLQGAQVVVVRVGGLLAPPNNLNTTTDENGYFDLSVFKPTDYGTMLLDIEFFPPAGSQCIGYVQHSLMLPTLDFDTGKRFIAGWDLPKR
jgi:hypothetical protein